MAPQAEGQAPEFDAIVVGGGLLRPCTCLHSAAQAGAVRPGCTNRGGGVRRDLVLEIATPGARAATSGERLLHVHRPPCPRRSSASGTGPESATGRPAGDPPLTWEFVTDKMGPAPGHPVQTRGWPPPCTTPERNRWDVRLADGGTGVRARFLITAGGLPVLDEHPEVSRASTPSPGESYPHRARGRTRGVDFHRQAGRGDRHPGPRPSRPSPRSPRQAAHVWGLPADPETTTFPAGNRPAGFRLRPPGVKADYKDLWQKARESGFRAAPTR